MIWTIIAVASGSLLLLVAIITSYRLIRKKKLAKYAGEDLTDIEDEV